MTSPGLVQAQTNCIEFDTELVSLDLTGGPFPIPLASDPMNSFGDSINGYGLVNCEVRITLSSQRAVNPGPRSLGKAFARDFGEDVGAAGTGNDCNSVIDPDELDGQQFFVNSFFDVFFDITVTDVDARPGRNINPADPPNATGTSIGLLDNSSPGDHDVQSFYQRLFDKDAPNFGLIPPPEGDPYIGHFDIQIPLGVDINGNGENDKVKFTLASHSAGDENRTFIVLPDGTTLDMFDSAAFLQGAVVDQSADPPFMIGAMLPNGQPDPASFGGPTTASSKLVNPVLMPFDICVSDQKKDRFLQINSATGEYLYTDCESGETLSGQGRIRRKGHNDCQLVLIHHRRHYKVQAMVDTCKHKGNVHINVKKPKLHANFHDKDTTDNTCRCP
jgi:hypothetical protein